MGYDIMLNEDTCRLTMSGKEIDYVRYNFGSSGMYLIDALGFNRGEKYFTKGQMNAIYFRAKKAKKQGNCSKDEFQFIVNALNDAKSCGGTYITIQ